MNIFNNIGLGIAAVGTIVAGWFGYAPVEQVNFGATTQSSEVRALFTTTLASRITSSATSMTLSSATDKDGTVLASSTYGFIIDEGTSKEELVLADCTGTTCTNMTRGLSVRTGTTTVAALQFEHGRGAEVKITDAPALIFASNVFRGKQNLEYKLRYDTTQTFSDGNDIISRSYADSLSFGAVPAANETTSGFVELATGIEIASSTSLGGSGARVVIPASLATSTYNSATAGLKVVVTQNNGKIDNNFLNGVVTASGNNTFIGSNTFSTSTTATTTIGAFPAWEIGKQKQIFTSDGNFTVPTGITKVNVHVIGGGGGGGGYSAAGGQSSGGGGGAGGYCFTIADVSATTTVAVTVGTGGSSTGETSKFSTFCQATGGNKGADAGSASGAAGGTGGLGSLGLVNTYGQGGSVGGAGCRCGGSGGASFIGGGAAQGGSPGYGGGGNGSSGSSGGITDSASNGGNGIVIITW